MRTVKIYLAPFIPKVHKERLNKAGEPFVSQAYVTVPSKKNQQQAIVSKSTGKPFVKQSDQYIKWKALTYPFFRKEAARIIDMGMPAKIIRGKIKIIFYFPNNVPRDLTNKAESIMDALVENEIIFDDQFQVINKENIEGYICKNQPRTEIYLHVIEPGDEEYEIDRTDYDKYKKQKTDLRKAIREWCKN